jgi:aminoglycoside phosphotransferase (APT) family kinase protein
VTDDAPGESPRGAPARLHDDEVTVDDATVRELITDQFPAWSHLRVRRLTGTGTVHAIFRLGDEFVVRVPRRLPSAAEFDDENEWLPHLAPRLPLEVPHLLAIGRPGRGYAGRWAVYRWIGGDPADIAQLADEDRDARALGEFLVALRDIPTLGAPALEWGSRGGPLTTRDDAARSAIDHLRRQIDVTRATEIWSAALAAPEWTAAPVWFHGDMLAANVIVRDGRIRAVIDFGGLGAGDPACDGMIAWSLLSSAGRTAFRAAWSVDDATWRRAAGHALAQSLIYIPYYERSNPGGVASAWRSARAVLADSSLP